MSLLLRLPFTGASPRTAAASSSGIRMLSRSGDTETVPGVSGWNSVCGALANSALEIPASDTSKAYAGGGSRKRERFILFDKRDLVDLFQGRNAATHLVHGGIAQERHAFFARQAFDLRRR